MLYLIMARQRTFVALCSVALKAGVEENGPGTTGPKVEIKDPTVAVKIK